MSARVVVVWGKARRGKAEQQSGESVAALACVLLGGELKWSVCAGVVNSAGCKTRVARSRRVRRRVSIAAEADNAHAAGAADVAAPPNACRTATVTSRTQQLRWQRGQRAKLTAPVALAGAAVSLGLFGWTAGARGARLKPAGLTPQALVSAGRRWPAVPALVAN